MPNVVFGDFVDRVLERTRQRITKRTHASCGCATIRNEPKARNSRRLEEQLDIRPILVQARATGGMLSSDVMENIGEIAARRDVNGRVATCLDRALPSPGTPG